MSYLSAITQFFKTWFLPMPAHDDPRFMAAQVEAETTSEKAPESLPEVAPVEPLQPEEPVEQVYGQPPIPDPSIVDPSIAEGTNDPMDDETYDPESDRDYAPGEPGENDDVPNEDRDETSAVSYDNSPASENPAASNEAAAPSETTSQQQEAPQSSGDNTPIKKVDPLPAGLPEAAEARASRAHSRVNPFTED